MNPSAREALEADQAACQACRPRHLVSEGDNRNSWFSCCYHEGMFDGIELADLQARYDALQAKVSEAVEYAESNHDLDGRQEVLTKIAAILSDTSQTTKEH